MTSFGKAAYLLFFFLTIVIATILRSFSDGRVIISMIDYITVV